MAANPLAIYEAATLQKWMARRLKIDWRIKWFINETLKKRKLNIAQRLKVATQLLRDKIAVNLSRPVRKVKKSVRVKDPLTGAVSTRTRTVVDPQSRSKRGEFPRADTTRLMKDIFYDVSPDGLMSRTGTSLKYGLVLEVRMDRSFIRRTFNEMRADIITILLHGAGPGAIGGSD